MRRARVVAVRSESDTARLDQNPTMLLHDQLYRRLDEEGRRRAAQRVLDVYLGGQRASANTLPNIVDVGHIEGCVHQGWIYIGPAIQDVSAMVL